jgi:hypothetical protein
VNTVSQTFADHILFSLPSMGLALGISQFFQSTYSFCYPGGGLQPNSLLFYQVKLVHTLFHPYCYAADLPHTAGQLHPLYPSTTVSVIGLLIIVAIACFEVGLNASIGTLAGFSRFSVSGIALMLGVSIRSGLLLLIAFVIPWMQDFLNYNLYCGNFLIVRTSICEYTTSSAWRSFYRTYDTLQLATMPLLDQGTFLAANVMRPNDDRWLELKSYRNPDRETLVRKNTFDNRPFVLRNLMALVVNGFLYALLIRFFLRRATRFAVRYHGASGYIEL